MIEAILLEIVAVAARQRNAGTEPEWFRAAVAYVEERQLRPIAIPAVARHAGVSISALSAAFREWRGMSATEYIRNLRLEHAATALRHSASPISEIAFESGFSDQAHFSRTFKAARGVTPREYRRVHSRAYRR
jgi:AraC family transcriptional regulator